MARGPLVERARAFRAAPTRSEALLWTALRGRALEVRVYRQKVIGPFIVDFVCERPRLIIEVDGPIHEQQLERDAQRQQYLEDRGYPVLRVTAADVENSVTEVVDRIEQALLDLTFGTDAAPRRIADREARAEAEPLSFPARGLPFGRASATGGRK